MDINNCVALVTGANRGLGRALVDALLERGAGKIYAAARDLAPLTGVDGRVVPLRLDLTVPPDIATAAEQAPDVTLLINNAGAGFFAEPFTADREAMIAEMAINYIGTVDVVRAFAPIIEVRGGAIVNVLSLLALASSPIMAGYSASKAAQHSFTQAIRPGLRKRGIAVHGVYPGAIDTDMLAAFDGPKTQPQVVATNILDGIAADREEIFPDPVSEQLATLWWSDPKSFELIWAGMDQ
jgi:NAD(P)-dependent dehydrogenase (short-subunit alcohol dehydrogenase family)